MVQRQIHWIMIESRMSVEDKSACELHPRHLRLSAALSAITLAQIFSAFGIQWYTVAHLGVGVQADALYAGATLSQIAIALLIEPLGLVLIPFFSSRVEIDKDWAGWPLLCVIGAASSISVAILFFLAPIVVPILAPGLAEPTADLAVGLAQIQVVGLVGVGCGTVLSCLSQAQGRFVWPALSVLICVCGGWVLLVFGLDRWGVRLAAWAQVFIVTGPALLIFPVVKKGGGGSCSDVVSLGKAVWGQMRPLVISASYNRTSFLVDRLLASLLMPGSIVILDLVWRIHSAIVRVLNQGLITPILPQLTSLSHRREWPQLVGLCKERLLWICGLSVMAVGLLGGTGLLCRITVLQDICKVLLGSLHVDDLSRIWIVLMSCSGVLLCASINHLLVSVFYAQGDTKTPAKIEAFANTIGFILKCVGCLLGGLIGIAIGVSCYYALNALLLGTVLRRRLSAQRLERDSRDGKSLAPVATC